MVKVISWNVRNLGQIQRPGRRGSGINVETRVSLISDNLKKLLNEYNDFVVFLLEVGEKSGKTNISDIFKKYFPSSNVKWFSAETKEGEGYLVIWNTKNYLKAIDDFEVIKTDITNKPPKTRSAIKSTLKFQDTSKLNVSTLHTPSSSGTYKNKRETNISEVINKLKSKKDNYLLLGDLNIEHKDTSIFNNLSKISKCLGPFDTTKGNTNLDELYKTSLKIGRNILSKIGEGSKKSRVSRSQLISLIESCLSQPYDQIWSKTISNDDVKLEESVIKFNFNVYLDNIIVQILEDSVPSIKNEIDTIITANNKIQNKLFADMKLNLKDVENITNKIDKELKQLLSKEEVDNTDKFSKLGEEISNILTNIKNGSPKKTDLDTYVRKLNNILVLIIGLLNSYIMQDINLRNFFYYEYAISDHLPISIVMKED